MKIKYAAVALLMAAGSMTLSAQNNNSSNNAKQQRPAREQMIQMQADRMTKALMLDDATAAKFKPMYEKYLSELRNCRMSDNCPMNADNNAVKAGGEKADKGAAKPALTDKEIAQRMKEQFAQSRKKIDIREKYYNEFSKILSQKQVMMIYRQEKNNMHKFRNEMDRRRGQKQGQRNKAGQANCPNRPNCSQSGR